MHRSDSAARLTSLSAERANAAILLYASHDRWIELFYLPRRSPDFNADEYLNDGLKGQIDDRKLPEGKDVLRSRSQRFLCGLLHLPERIKNHFRHACVQYAAGLWVCHWNSAWQRLPMSGFDIGSLVASAKSHWPQP